MYSVQLYTVCVCSMHVNKLLSMARANIRALLKNQIGVFDLAVG